jgi:hypothetical protein
MKQEEEIRGVWWVGESAGHVDELFRGTPL